MISAVIRDGFYRCMYIYICIAFPYNRCILLCRKKRKRKVTFPKKTKSIVDVNRAAIGLVGRWEGQNKDGDPESQREHSKQSLPSSAW